jgi:flagellar biosynthesis protein FlhF
MKVKSYFVPSVAAALALARQELGPEAVLLETRAAPPEAAHLGRYEVVFGTPAAGAAANGKSAAEAGVPGVAPTLMREVERLRRELERVNAAMARSSLTATLQSLPCEEEARVLARLLEAEMDPQLAREILEAARHRVTAEGAGRAEAVSAELSARCRTDSRLGRKAQGPRVAAFVGPSGAGKTSLIAKLAVREGLGKRQSVELLSLDCYRVGGAEQLRHYAAILGVPFQALETRHALEQALRESKRKDLVLIDTPGLDAAEEQEAGELAEWLAAQGEVECHLVLTASMRSADLWRVAERFERFRPSKLAFTRLDEGSVFGPLWSLALRLERAVSFLSAGQRVPEDVEAATVGRLLGLLGLHEGARRAVGVAA